MPKTAAAIATPLMLLTMFVFWQFLGLATTRTVSTPDTQSPERLALASAAHPNPPQVVSEAVIERVEPAISPRTPLLERLTIDRFARYEVPPHDGAVIMVESGNLRVQVSPVHLPHTATAIETSDSPNAPTFSHVTADESLVAPARAPVDLANMELQPAIVLLLTIPFFDPADDRWAPPIPDPLPAGVTREMQVRISRIAANTGPLSISLRPMQIEPGATVSNHLVTESEQLLVVVDGIIEVSVQEGNLTLMSGPETASDQSGAMTLSAGEGIAAPAGVELAWRAAGHNPAIFVLVTVASAEMRTSFP